MSPGAGHRHRRGPATLGSRLAAVALVAGVVGAVTTLRSTPAGAVDAVTVLGPPPPAAPVYDHDAPDPDVLRVDSSVGTTYYAYTTASVGGHIPVLQSSDLRNWTYDGDALPTVASWSRPGRTWAPGVVALGGTYVMYYSTRVAATGQQCISMATATSPTGPFADDTAGPLVCQGALGGSIDPSPLLDSDGTPYLYWKSNAGSSAQPAHLWAARLSTDGSSLVSAPVDVLDQDQSWEATIEAPSMVHSSGRYVLFYSGGLWNGPGYGVGAALCQGPLGPCGKPQDGPLVYSDQHRLGPGSASLFSDSAGDLFMAYDAWDGPASDFSYAAGGFRSLWIAAVTVGSGAVAVQAGEAPQGYLLAASDGGIFAFGGAAFHGSMGGRPLAAPVVGLAGDRTSGGYWEAAADGGVFAFGAPYGGSMGGRPLSAPIVGMAATPDGNGYWLVAADGGVFAFGDAPYAGSMGGRPLAAPIVGMAATPDGNGYWLVAADGGVFAFGDAPYAGSMGGQALGARMVALEPMPQGGGYWETAADGGVFSFGAARFFGSMGGTALARPVVTSAAGPGGGGYWLVGADGGIFAFGDGDFLGSMGGTRLVAPVVAAVETGP